MKVSGKTFEEVYAGYLEAKGYKIGRTFAWLLFHKVAITNRLRAVYIALTEDIEFEEDESAPEPKAEARPQDGAEQKDDCTCPACTLRRAMTSGEAVFVAMPKNVEDALRSFIDRNKPPVPSKKDLS